MLTKETNKAMPIERLVDVFDSKGQQVGRYIVETPGLVQDVVYERRAIDYAIQHGDAYETDRPKLMAFIRRPKAPRGNGGVILGMRSKSPV